MKCSDFDLCTQCFMDDHHDLSHPFSLYENSSSLGFVKLSDFHLSILILLCYISLTESQ